jgi:sucrose-phosphate synthase
VVDPLDTDAIAQSLLDVLGDREDWERMAQSGLDGVQEHYSWTAHADRYIADVRELLEATEPRPEPVLRRRPMLFHDRALFSDLDQNLLGDANSIPAFVEVMRKNHQRATFGIATGRKLKSALAMLRRYSIPLPNVLISSVGTEIHYGPEMTPDTAWRRHIDHLWTPRRVRGLLRDLPGLELQDRSEQSWAKLSYHYDPEVGPSPEEITSLLHKNEQTVNMFVSFGQYIDIVPVRASKGFALRWFAEHWEIPLNRILAAGGSGTDEDILRGNTLAVVVGNRHDEELSELGDGDRIYFAEESYALGILEAIDHYDFYGECRDPEAE